MGVDTRNFRNSFSRHHHYSQPPSTCYIPLSSTHPKTQTQSTPPKTHSTHPPSLPISTISITSHITHITLHNLNLLPPIHLITKLPPLPLNPPSQCMITTMSNLPTPSPHLQRSTAPKNTHSSP
ncbi:hypothetical protein M758_9G172600 [Ceratodon purpureus]|nr:hypothetical protein M758_9G172600 [Ceratodon purpureus]